MRFTVCRHHTGGRHSTHWVRVTTAHVQKLCIWIWVFTLYCLRLCTTKFFSAYMNRGSCSSIAVVSNCVYSLLRSIEKSTKSGKHTWQSTIELYYCVFIIIFQEVYISDLFRYNACLCLIHVL